MVEGVCFFRDASPRFNDSLHMREYTYMVFHCSSRSTAQLSTKHRSTPLQKAGRTHRARARAHRMWCVVSERVRISLQPKPIMRIMQSCRRRRRQRRRRQWSPHARTVGNFLYCSAHDHMHSMIDMYRASSRSWTFSEYVYDVLGTRDAREFWLCVGSPEHPS